MTLNLCELPGITIPVRIKGAAGKRTVMNCIMTPIQKSLGTAFREKSEKGLLWRAYSIQNIQP